MGTELWPGIAEQIKETDRLLNVSSRNTSILSLVSLVIAQLPFEESVQIVAHAVEGIFYNCGLSFQTIPEGVYISVDAPSR